MLDERPRPAARSVQPHRYAWALAAGRSIEEPEVVEHLCDKPICVRAEGGFRDQLAAFTQAVNLVRMGAQGRGGGDPVTWRRRASDRATLAARSRALRRAVKDGWDADRIAAALEQSSYPDQLVLW